MLPPASNASRPSTRWLVGLLALLLACLLTPAMAQETCGTDPTTSPNHSDNYILGEVGGEGSAMHWETGLVWKRCAQGRSGEVCDAGSDETRPWNDWMGDFMPKSFTGQDAWWGSIGSYTPNPATGPAGVDRLHDGTWRMAYRHELLGITTGCANAPKINRNIFPNTSSSYVWSGSPYASLTYLAWFVNFNDGGGSYLYRSNAYGVRLVRGGQGFGLLSDPAPRTQAAGSQTTFDAITLASSSGSGTAWGGARISGAGNPEFSLDGGSTWVTEAIVQSGDSVTVRMTAGAAGTSRTATLTLRSGQTEGTADGSAPGSPSTCPTCGEEATIPAETTASFTVTGTVPPETCGTDPATSPNHSDNYILGQIGGVGSAMHWETGLVWKRCMQGRSGEVCDVGSDETRRWNEWMDEFMPKSFTGQDAWWGSIGGYTPNPATGPAGVDRLHDGTWRMAYRRELLGITTGCADNPKINRNVFPSTSSSHVWSGSPYAGNAYYAWSVYFGLGYDGDANRSYAFGVRLVRGGQGFGLLSDPAPRTQAAGSQTTFDAITLDSSSGSGTAWGGARISGAGNPEFSLDGGSTWVTEAIVQSGDSVTVRMTAGAPNTSRTATLTLRSGQTEGTADGSAPGSPSTCPTCGEEATIPAETTASFTVTGTVPPETCGTDPATSPNHSDNYILGEVGGEGSAMNWETGLVWKRCAQGRSGADCSAGNDETRRWNEWMDEFMPKSFTGQDAWWGSIGSYTPNPATGPVGVDRLHDGTWRMAYHHELVSLTAGCANAPKINRNIFPNTSSSYVWSGSPNAYYSDDAWNVYFDDGYGGDGSRSLAYGVRLVRGGQWFGLLSDPAPRTQAAGSQTTFDAITLASSSGSGTAWGGARISGAGNPEFSLDGGSTWATEAIVQSGDSVTVRMTAGAAGTSRTATLTLRSGQTEGTADGSAPGSPSTCPTCGEEATIPAETTASFTVSVLNVFNLNYTAGPGGTLTGAVSQSVTEGDDGSPVTAVPATGHHFTGWDDGLTTATRTDTNVQADLDVTASFAINTYTVTFVDWDGTTLATQTVNHGSDAVAPADPTRTGYAFTGWDVPFTNVTGDLTVTAQYSINTYTVSASVLGGHGSISPASQGVDHGDTVSFTVTPDAGYHAVMPAGGDCPAGSLSGDQYSTGAITTDCTVTVHFDQNLADGLAVYGGDAQDVPVLDAFPVALSVRVADAGDVPLAGVAVNFMAPASGASAVLSSNTAMTDANGIASVSATANAIAGSYDVEASLAGAAPRPGADVQANSVLAATPVVFALTNTALAATLDLSVAPTTVLPGQTATLTVTVTGGGSLIPGGTVDFLVDGAIVCAAVPVDATGVAACTAGPFSTGWHSADAAYSGDASHEPAVTAAAIGLAGAAPLNVPTNHPLALLLLLLGMVVMGGWKVYRRG